MEKLVNLGESIFVSAMCMVVTMVLGFFAYAIVCLLIDFPLVLIASIVLWVFFYFLLKRIS